MFVKDCVPTTPLLYIYLIITSCIYNCINALSWYRYTSIWIRTSFFVFVWQHYKPKMLPWHDTWCALAKLYAVHDESRHLFIVERRPHALLQVVFAVFIWSVICYVWVVKKTHLRTICFPVLFWDSNDVLDNFRSLKALFKRYKVGGTFVNKRK